MFCIDLSHYLLYNKPILFGNGVGFMESREKLSSRLGFILLSAGCAIGCGNVWKFPWMCGQYGGGAFVVIYLLFLVILGLPVMTIEFSLGRASQKSPIKMLGALEPKGTKWHAYSYPTLIGNCLLMMFYTSVTGWIMYYFIRFLGGGMNTIAADAVGAFNNAVEAGDGSLIAKIAEGLKILPEEVNVTNAVTYSMGGAFGGMLASTPVTLIVMAVVVILGFGILSLGVQKGLEKVTKYMMVALLILMFALAINSFTLSGAKEGLKFYLLPDFSKIDVNVVVGAMNQAFFTLSLGIGSMAIFGSYIGKERSLMGESVNIILLDTLVAITAGLIIFPACYTYNIQPDAGPALLFITMSTVFTNMAGGRIWGTLFFLFMFFAAMSTVLAVFENILAMVCEATGWKRKKGCLICCIAMLILAAPCALGNNVWANFNPFAFAGLEGKQILDLEDFLVSNCLLPLGSMLYVLFVVAEKKGWGWNNFKAEANTGKGLKVKDWIHPYVRYVLPVIIAVLFVMGMISFFG